MNGGVGVGLDEVWVVVERQAVSVRVKKKMAAESRLCHVEQSAKWT